MLADEVGKAVHDSVRLRSHVVVFNWQGLPTEVVVKLAQQHLQLDGVDVAVRDTPRVGQLLVEFVEVLTLLGVLAEAHALEGLAEVLQSHDLPVSSLRIDGRF